MIPRTGQALTPLGLGCAPLGNLFAAMSDAAARETVDTAWDLGFRYFDTAPLYGHTLSERRLGEALRHRDRGDFKVSTKVGRVLEACRDDAWTPSPASVAPWVDPARFVPRFDYTAKGMRQSIHGSLERLGVAQVDLALIHDIGPTTHGAAAHRYWRQLIDGGGLAELQAMRREGCVGGIGVGVNEWPVVLEVMKHAPLDCVLLAGRYTLLEQGALHPFLDECLRAEVGVIIGGPFNSGVLATGVEPGSAAPATFNYRPAPADVLARVARLQRVCEAHGVALPAAALQFPLAHPAVVSCVPGARDARELAANVGWLSASIPDELWEDLRRHGLLAADAPTPSGANAGLGG
ncbi:MAG: aldo/keto reductase [Pseudomonadota bacterium]|nr:aldo/keto reductase [Pseudomonadota bacterium]